MSGITSAWPVFYG